METTILKEFTSEVEARVVESYLRAEGFDVAILDTHSPATHRHPGGRRGFRLAVRTDEVDKIQQLLEERLKTAHLRLVDEDEHIETQSGWSNFVQRIKNFFGY